MKVENPKKSLTGRKLSRNGLKAVLVARLKDAVVNGMVSVENIDPKFLSNMAGDNF